MDFLMSAHSDLIASLEREGMTTLVMPTQEESRRGMDVVYVLCLMQVAFLLLGAVGEQLLMGGNPLYLGLPLVKVILLFVFATKAVKGRRWAMVALLVTQAITVGGFVLQFVVGALLPMLDYTVNLVGLLTNVGLPVAVAWLCVAELRVYARSPSYPECVNRASFLSLEPAVRR
jgi:hypothetical protein